jgi:hypothetical protein
MIAALITKVSAFGLASYNQYDFWNIPSGDDIRSSSLLLCEKTLTAGSETVYADGIVLTLNTAHLTCSAFTACRFDSRGTRYIEIICVKRPLRREIHSVVFLKACMHQEQIASSARRRAPLINLESLRW